jgi:hypothetical protein
MVSQVRVYEWVVVTRPPMLRRPVRAGLVGSNPTSRTVGGSYLVTVGRQLDAGPGLGSVMDLPARVALAPQFLT